MSNHTPEPLVSIPWLAGKLGKPYRSVLRWLLKAHGEDRAAGRPEWLVRIGKALRLNLSVLRASHPAFFGVRKVVDRDDLDEWHERVTESESRISANERRTKSLERTISELTKRVERLERGKRAA